MEQEIEINEVAPLPQGIYVVTVTDADGSTSTHRVHVDESFLGDLGLPPEEGGKPVPAGEVYDIIKRSVAFLLAREPKESILAEFDLRDIKKYFPEYPGEMP